LVGGHQRLKIAQELNIKEIPCVEVELNPDQEKELNIRLNKNSGEWDYDALANYFDVGELTEWGFTDDELQFYEDDKEDENIYTQKIETPKYEPTGNKPTEEELYNEEKVKELIKKIGLSNIKKEEKEFLIKAAYRHTVFNYKNIAEFYVHSSKEIQELMEDSALVIIDFKKAIEGGYIALNEKITNQYLEEHGN